MITLAAARLHGQPSEDDLGRLLAVRTHPLVSLLLPTQPGGVMAEADRAALEALLDRAERRLEAETDAATCERIIGRLREIANGASSSSMSRSLALFAGVDSAEGFRIPTAVCEQVVVDDSFATRELARMITEHPPYRVLVLGGGTARLLLAAGGDVEELSGGGFPFEEAQSESESDRRGHVLQAEPSHRRPHRWDRFLREVDSALRREPSLQGSPLLVVAAEPLLSRYRQLASTPVAGELRGNHERTAARRLGELTRPVITAHLEALRQQDLDALDGAIGRRQAAVGIDEVWAAAAAGRVRLLLVANDYLYPASLAGDGRLLDALDDPTTPHALDDAVDEVVEAVWRRGGRVRFFRREQLRVGIAAVCQ